MSTNVKTRAYSYALLNSKRGSILMDIRGTFNEKSTIVTELSRKEIAQLINGLSEALLELDAGVHEQPLLSDIDALAIARSYRDAHPLTVNIA